MESVEDGPRNLLLKFGQNWSLGKIGAVTAEIFLIWTNVAMTNVALTNVIIIVGICLRWSQKAAFKVWSKSSQ